MASTFLRVLRHLLPDGAAWRLAAEKTLRRFFEGLATHPGEARQFVDEVHEDRFPSKTRELRAWERQFGLPGRGTEAQRRQQLSAAWQALGGQSPRYLQDVVQEAGFPLYVHEWWESGPDPYVPRDPREYTQTPLIGTTQCGEPLAQCGEASAQCNRFLANDPHYLVNKDLTPNAPPPVPDDPATWPYFLYFGGETFGEVVPIAPERRPELEELLLRICPAQQWIVLIVDSPSTLITQGGDTRITQGGDTVITQ